MWGVLGLVWILLNRTDLNISAKNRTTFFYCIKMSSGSSGRVWQLQKKLLAESFINLFYTFMTKESFKDTVSLLVSFTWQFVSRWLILSGFWQRSNSNRRNWHVLTDSLMNTVTVCFKVLWKRAPYQHVKPPFCRGVCCIRPSRGSVILLLHRSYHRKLYPSISCTTTLLESESAEYNCFSSV